MDLDASFQYFLEHDDVIAALPLQDLPNRFQLQKAIGMDSHGNLQTGCYCKQAFRPVKKILPFLKTALQRTTGVYQ